jgi:hypothetical protein
VVNTVTDKQEWKWWTPQAKGSGDYTKITSTIIPETVAPRPVPVRNIVPSSHTVNKPVFKPQKVTETIMFGTGYHPVSKQFNTANEAYRWGGIYG